VTDPKNSAANQMVPIDNELLRGVEVKLDALLGRGRMTAEELMSLSKGSVVTLENSLADHVELYLNEALVARGEIVAVGDHFGVRITEIAPAS
jgi:flagellar motor switch protein FliN/FliY